jgi:hypothetical protein
MSPREVDECTLWELAACVDAYNRANGAEEQPEPPSSQEFDDMIARHSAIVTMAVH